MIDANKFKRISQRIDSYREAMIELQTALSPECPPWDRKMAMKVNY